MFPQPARAPRATHERASPAAARARAGPAPVATIVPACGPLDARREAVSKVPISARQKRELRARSHHLKPVVQVGAAGPSAAVLAELDAALEAHELIKLRVRSPDRAARRELVETLCRQCGAELVNTIGHTAVLYRERREE